MIGDRLCSRTRQGCARNRATLSDPRTARTPRTHDRREVGLQFVGWIGQFLDRRLILVSPNSPNRVGFLLTGGASVYSDYHAEG